jgi:tellurite resistance protein
MNVDTSAIRRLKEHLLSHTEKSATTDSEQAPVSRTEALIRRVNPFAETMYLVMIADGSRADIERRVLVSAIDILTDGVLPAADMESMIDQFAENVDRGGAEARFAQLGSRICVDRDDRETAFSLGAVIALADEKVDVKESQALKWICQYYGVSERRAAEILGSI